MIVSPYSINYDPYQLRKQNLEGLANIQPTAEIPIPETPEIPDTLSQTPLLATAGGGGGIEPISQGIAATVGLIGNTVQMANQSLNLPKPPDQQVSATGEPVYNLGAYYNQVSTAKPQEATFGEIIGGATSGVGILTGIGAALFGGSRRARKQREEKRRASRIARKSQKQYNEASIAFDESQAAQQDYMRRQNMTNRLYNLYQ